MTRNRLPHGTVALLSLGSALGGCDSPAADASKDEVITEGWQEVRRQFVEDEGKAMRRFKGKRVEWSAMLDFTGTGEKIDEGVLAVLSPDASTKTAFAAWFANDLQSEVFALRRGQVVTVSCRLENIAKESFRVAITLEACRLVRVVGTTASADTEAAPPTPPASQ